MIKKALALSLCMLACGTSPPDEIAIDPAFNPMQRAVIEDTLDHWCKAVDWCPRIVERSDHRIIADVGPFPRPAGYPEDLRVAAFNDLNNIRVDMTMLDVVDDPIRLWRLVGHELGHFGNPSHATRGLMNLKTDVRLEPCLDTFAVGHWCEHQSCPSLAQTTCIQNTQPE